VLDNNTLVPTDEQAAIIKAAASGSNLMVTAYAGCAKTSTLCMIAQGIPPKPALALAFNKKIQKELALRFPDFFTVKTLNGLGHMAWGRAIGRRCQIDEKKLGNLVTDQLKLHGMGTTQEEWNTIRQLVSSAMNNGLVPAHFKMFTGLLPDTDNAWETLAEDLFEPCTKPMIEVARQVLVESCKLSFQGILSFDDQIYMSALFGGVFPRFPLVMVDEAQDLSPLNHIQVQRCAAEQLIVVGDPKQAIYSFRGADSASMSKLRKLRQDWIDLPLTRTFRCPKTIVSRQQEHAPGFRAAETNLLGRVLPFLNLKALNQTWSWADVVLPPGKNCAILCRNNAPLLGMAFKLLRQRVGCYMIGRDIGKSLIALSRKIMPLNDIPAEICINLINDWASSERSIALANGNDGKVAAIVDRQECLLAVLDSGCANSQELREQLQLLFSREGGQVALSTGHKAKGLEWDIVIHLDPWRIPTRHAKAALAEGNPIPMEQELNLRYVIETRAKDTLLMYNLEDFAL
jgi:DNA helicase II / ATP-dependent DNA helicase PcrA